MSRNYREFGGELTATYGEINSALKGVSGFRPVLEIEGRGLSRPFTQISPPTESDRSGFSAGCRYYWRKTYDLPSAWKRLAASGVGQKASVVERR
jgi:hypothetical protein